MIYILCCYLFSNINVPDNLNIPKISYLRHEKKYVNLLDTFPMKCYKDIKLDPMQAMISLYLIEILSRVDKIFEQQKNKNLKYTDIINFLFTDIDSCFFKIKNFPLVTIFIKDIIRNIKKDLSYQEDKNHKILKKYTDQINSLKERKKYIDQSYSIPEFFLQEKIYSDFHRNNNKEEFLGDLYGFLRAYHGVSQYSILSKNTLSFEKIQILENFFMYFTQSTMNSFIYILNESKGKNVTELTFLLEQSYDQLKIKYNQHQKTLNEDIFYSTHIKTKDTSFIRYLFQNFPKTCYEEFINTYFDENNEVDMKTVIKRTIEYNFSLFLIQLAYKYID